MRPARIENYLAHAFKDCLQAGYCCQLNLVSGRRLAYIDEQRGSYAALEGHLINCFAGLKEMKRGIHVGSGMNVQRQPRDVQTAAAL